MKDIMSAGLLLEPYQIIIRPLVTEKGVMLTDKTFKRAKRDAEGNKVRDSKGNVVWEEVIQNAYSFQVHTDATKEEIKDAIEKLYDVKVVKVNTQNRKGKQRRFKQRVSYTSDWKKAIVYLDAESRIDFV
ncbi:MAG: 50S ribosomal protein L23 [Thermoguttaceae bacterium]|nr:50S ribosomal protein L23 [Thermoguttaceae bacterium]